MNDVLHVYLETSALVGIYRQERFSSQVLSIVSDAPLPIVLTQLSLVEFDSAVARLVRAGDLTEARAAHVEKIFSGHIREGLFRIEPIMESVFWHARDWVSKRDTPLRTLDSLHLSSARLLGCLLVTGDQVLAKAAARFELPCTLLGIMST